MSSVEISVSTSRKTSGNAPSKNNVSFELFAPRSTAQVSRLSRIGALTAGPTSLGLGETKCIKKKTDILSDDSVLKAMSPPNQSSAQKLSLDEQKRTSATIALDNAIQNSHQLTSLLKHTTSLRLALRASINIAEDISNRHAELIRHSGELSAAADRLQGEQEMLSRHAEEIGVPLKHYDTVDDIGILVGVLFKGKDVVRGLAKVKVDNDGFPSILDRIDEAVEFFARECGGRDALEIEIKRQRSSNSKEVFETSGNVEYYRRSLALQDAALFLIREAVVDRISTTTVQVSSALNIPKIPIAADKLEASLVYTRFYGISSRSNRLLSFVRKRLHRGEAYHALLQLCRTTYCNCRESLLRTTIRAHMDKLKDQHGLVGMTRLASVFLIRLCTVETVLYLDFFGDKKVEDEGERSKDGSENDNNKNKSKQSKMSLALAPRTVHEDGSCYDKDFQAYLASLTSALHRTIRRGLVTLVDLDTLCQIVSVLREERSMASSSPTTLAAARSISNVIEDAQERLIFCATNSLTKEVIRYKASPIDLDYPNKLTKKLKNISEEKSGNTNDAVKQQLQVYELWFPPMRSVLKILSKIFRVVEPKVFEDIALQSVQSCTRALKDGSKYIKKKSGEIHADLFLVKHLLILREQLSPFDIDLRSVERQLDFSDAGRAVSRFLANRNRRLFSMSTENALITLLREGVSVNEESVDSKRDLEEALRSACNDFIDHICNFFATELFDVVEKLNGSTPENLTNASLFEPNKLKDMLAKTLEEFEPKAAEVLNKMNLYLENSATQSILLKPVSKKISKGLEEIRKGVDGMTDENSGWEESMRAGILDLVTKLEKTVKKVGRAPK